MDEVVKCNTALEAKKVIEFARKDHPKKGPVYEIPNNWKLPIYIYLSDGCNTYHPDSRVSSVWTFEMFESEFLTKKNETEALWEEAKKRYPIGTTFRIAHSPSEIRTVRSHDTWNTRFVWDKTKLHINLLVEKQEGDKCEGGSVYYNGKWAEVILDEPKVAKQEQSKNFPKYHKCIKEGTSWMEIGRIYETKFDTRPLWKYDGKTKDPHFEWDSWPEGSTLFQEHFIPSTEEEFLNQDKKPKEETLMEMIEGKWYECLVGSKKWYFKYKNNGSKPGNPTMCSKSFVAPNGTIYNGLYTSNESTNIKLVEDMEIIYAKIPEERPKSNKPSKGWHIKYTPEFTEDIFKCLIKWCEKELAKYPNRVWRNDFSTDFEKFKSPHNSHFIYFGDRDCTFLCGVDNNPQGFPPISLKELCTIIGYKTPEKGVYNQPLKVGYKVGIDPYDSDEITIEAAKERYPIGSIFRCKNNNTQVTVDENGIWEKGNINGPYIMYRDTTYRGYYAYLNNMSKEWAIPVLPASDTTIKELEKWIPKVGDWVVFMPEKAKEIGYYTSTWNKPFVLKIDEMGPNGPRFHYDTCIKAGMKPALNNYCSNDIRCFRKAESWEIPVNNDEIRQPYKIDEIKIQEKPTTNIKLLSLEDDNDGLINTSLNYVSSIKTKLVEEN